MENLGQYVVYLVMVFVACGAIAAVRDDTAGMGREFVSGLHAIGLLFVPVAAVLAAEPMLVCFVKQAIAPLFVALGADAAMAATTLVSVDMGGYQMAHALTQSREHWIIASFNGFLTGPHIVFTIPVALAMLPKRDHRYLALGMMAGFATIPVSLLAGLGAVAAADPLIRSTISTSGAPDYRLSLGMGQVLRDLFPLTLLLAGIVAGLRWAPNVMVRGFIAAGRCGDALIKLVLAACIIEYFSGFFSKVFGQWTFLPLIGDAQQPMRGLEVCGYIGIMLAGAFPMVYAIRTYLGPWLATAGRVIGFSPLGTSGLIATTANPLALFHLVPAMDARNKVLTISYAVSGSWILGDSLAFIANFQPTLIVPLMGGKIVGAIAAVYLARWLCVPRAERFEAEDRLKEQAAIDADAHASASTKPPDDPVIRQSDLASI